MANKNVLLGYRCPHCDSEGPFDIYGHAIFLRVTDDGVTDFTEFDWDPDAMFTCISCKRYGIAKEFKAKFKDPKEMDPQTKELIDNMSHEEMARKWRFGTVGGPLFQGKTGKYFHQRFQELGGMTAKVSKAIGWDKKKED